MQPDELQVTSLENPFLFDLRIQLILCSLATMQSKEEGKDQ